MRSSGYNLRGRAAVSAVCPFCLGIPEGFDDGTLESGAMPYGATAHTHGGYVLPLQIVSNLHRVLPCSQAALRLPRFSSGDRRLVFALSSGMQRAQLEDGEASVRNISRQRQQRGVLVTRCRLMPSGASRNFLQTRRKRCQERLGTVWLPIATPLKETILGDDALAAQALEVVPAGEVALCG